jgi:hypothetical protein
MFHTRWRRATMAAVASLCASGAAASAADAAPGDLPRLAQQAPTGITMGYYDDHSLGGDNHTGWDHDGSDGEPLAISFQSMLRNTGPGVLQLCATNGSDTWRSARQTAPGSLSDCSGATVNTSNLWFRYVIANHSDENPPTFNRWHVMDLQRFALVPMRPDGQADTSRPTIWDSQWGTCLDLDGDMACNQTAGTATINAGISNGYNKFTQEGAPDQAVIAFRSLEMIGTGRYQVVAMSNPYGVYREAGNATGSVACTTVQITADQNAGTFALQQVAGTPTQCLLPRAMQSRVTGAGGVDPLQNAAADIGCPLNTVDDPEDPADLTGHCWIHVPLFANEAGDPLAPHPLARTNVNDARATTATNAVLVPAGSAISTNQGGGTAPTPVVTVPKTTPTVTVTPPVITPKVLPGMTTAHGRSYVRRALRATFGTLPTTASVSCRLTGGSTAECTASWRRPGGIRYRGDVRVWFTSDAQHVSWIYGLTVKRTKRGSATRTTTRSNRVGGAVS